MITAARSAETHFDPYPPSWAAGLRRLNPDQPVEGFEHRRWLLLLQDCWQLLGDHGADLHRLDWRANDLFGADPDAPAARLDRAGLVLVICGGMVDRVRPDAITIRSPSGALLCFRRPGNGGVPLWEIGT
jgi:hypothetical protein